MKITQLKLPYLMKFKILTIVICIFVLHGCKKEEEKKSGCTDKTATNYDSEATENCCCEYATALTSDFTPPTGADLSSSDLESPAYFRLLKARSTDGITFTTTDTLVTDQGNTPDMIIKDDKIFLYYTGWNLGSVQNTTAVAISEDYGQSWVFKNCSFSGFGTGVKPVDPDAILLSSGSVRLFETTNIGPKNAVICYESTDGINFSFVDTAASSATDHIFDSNTFELNGAWHMNAINALGPTHWHLTSSNGINFTVAGTNTFLDGPDQHFIGNGFQNGSAYKIFSAFLPKQHIKSFSTIDGSTWTIDSGNRLTYGGSNKEVSYLKDPAVIKLPDNTYLMVYVSRIQ